MKKYIYIISIAYKLMSASFHFSVKFREVNVAKQGGQVASLWRPCLSFPDNSIYHHTTLEKFPDKPQ